MVLLSYFQSLKFLEGLSEADVQDTPIPVLPLLKQRRPGPDKPRRGIPPEQWPDVLRLIEQGQSLRHVASQYNVSYETVRRVIAAMRKEKGDK